MRQTSASRVSIPPRRDDVTGAPGLGNLLRSLPWPAAEAMGATLSGAVSVFVIARIIGVQDFGVAAVALAAVILLQIGVNSLVHDALVRAPSLHAEDVDVGFTASLAAAIAFAAIAAVAAPFLAAAVEAPPVEWLIVLFLPLLPLAAVSETLKAVRRRALDFRSVARIQIAGSLAGGLLGIGAAILGAGVWSLGVQYLSAAAIVAGLLLASADRAPRLRVSVSRLTPMVRFCGPIIASQFLGHATARFVLLAVASWHGVVAAGLWSMTVRIADSLFGGLLQSAYNVGLSHFALRQSNLGELAVLIDRTQSVAIFALLPLVAGLAAASEPLIGLLLGPAWTPVAWLVLGPFAASLILVRRMPPSTALRAVGNSTASFAASVAEVSATLAGMLAFGRLSLEAISVIAPFAAFAGALVIALQAKRTLGMGLRRQGAMFVRDAVIAVAAFAAGRAALEVSPFPGSLAADALVAGIAGAGSAVAMLAVTETKLLRILFTNRRLPAAAE